MDVECAYRCFKDDSILPKKLAEPYPKPTPCLYVELRLCNKLKKLANGNAGGDDAVVELYSVMRPFCFDHVLFFNEEETKSFVSVFLSHMSLPDGVKDSIIAEMFEFARSMMNDEENAGVEALPLVVDVAVIVVQMPGESEDDAIARAGDRLQKL
jgi:hypothetical protein